jgi:hypothetical protein
MKDFVSGRWASVVVWVAATSVAWVILDPAGGFRTSFAGGTLLGFMVLASIALWKQTGPERSTRDIIDDVEAEPAQLVPAPAYVAVPGTDR